METKNVIKFVAIILFILAIAIFATSLSSQDVDELCSTNGSYLFRTDNGWGCGMINTTFGNNETLMKANECLETTCETFVEVNENY